MSRSTQNARRNQASFELTVLREHLQQWHDRCTAADVHADGSQRGQYNTQLAAIRDEVAGAAERLDSGIKTIDLERSVGEVYADCARVERQVVWLWRAFDFFRDKFDQRFDPRFQQVLKAADEVIWSSYRPFYRFPATTHRGGPAPIPFVESDYSPSALRQDQQRALGRKGQDFLLLEQAFKQLPVATIKVPVTAIANPWMLVLLGHEVGHLVMRSVKPPAAYVGTFSKSIMKAIETSGGNSAQQSDWGRWSEEIFADWYSVLAMGHWAIWAMAQFELADRQAMLNRNRVVYPAPVVRLALMAALADFHKLPGSSMLAALSVDPAALALGVAPVEQDLGFIPHVVAAITEPLPDSLGHLEQLVGLQASDFVTSTQPPIPPLLQWSRHLSNRGARPQEVTLHTARLVAAATAAAWSETVLAPDALDSEKAAQHLRSDAPRHIIGAATGGTRAVTLPESDAHRERGALLFRTVMEGADGEID